MSRLSWVVVVFLCWLIAGCSGGPATIDAEPPDGSLVVSGARLLVPKGDSDRVLQMTLRSASPDRLVGITLAGSAEGTFALHRSFSGPSIAGASPMEETTFSPTEQITEVALQQGEPVTFGWNGYAAVLNDVVVDRNLSTVEVRLEFEEHEPVQLPVAVVSQ